VLLVILWKDNAVDVERVERFIQVELSAHANDLEVLTEISKFATALAQSSIYLRFANIPDFWKSGKGNT